MPANIGIKTVLFRVYCTWYQTTMPG